VPIINELSYKLISALEVPVEAPFANANRRNEAFDAQSRATSPCDSDERLFEPLVST
jgi:hypothetical protein